MHEHRVQERGPRVRFSAPALPQIERRLGITRLPIHGRDGIRERGGRRGVALVVRVNPEPGEGRLRGVGAFREAAFHRRVLGQRGVDLLDLEVVELGDEKCGPRSRLR